MSKVYVAGGDSIMLAHASSVTEAGADAGHADVHNHKEIKQEPADRESDDEETQPGQDCRVKYMWEVSVSEGDSTKPAPASWVTEAGAGAGHADVHSHKEIKQEPADQESDDEEIQPGQDCPVKNMWKVSVAEGDSTKLAHASSVAGAGADAGHADVHSHKEIKQEPADQESDDKEETRSGHDRPVKGDIFNYNFVVEIKVEAPGELYPEHVKPEEIVIEPDVLQPDGLTAHDTSETSSTVRSSLLYHQYLWPHASGTQHRCEGGERVTHAASRAKGKRKYICDICMKSFMWRGSLVKHLNIHSGRKPFHCEICKKQFSEKHHLTCHERTHTEMKQFHCKICNKQFFQKNLLAIHERNHGESIRFHCKTCNKGFSRKNRLAFHERTHIERKPIHCKFCKKQFPRNNQLIVHERTHTGEKPFNCKTCNKSFSCKSNLTVHERSHTGEKPFHCKICKKSFSTKSNLIGHERTHTEETPFHCKLCKKKFSRKGRLAAHELTHAGK